MLTIGRKTSKSLLKKIIRFLENHYIFIIIFLAGAILRFCNFPYRFSLGDETVRDAVIGIYGARMLQAPLIGAFSSAGPFTFGPWFYYQMILASLVFPYSYAPWIYLSLSSILSMLLLYKIGIKLENKILGLILAVLGAVSPALITSGTILTCQNLLSFYAIFTVFLFIKIIKDDLTSYWYLFFGFILGIALNIHYQAIALLLLPLSLVFYYSLKALSKLKQLVWTGVGLFLTFIPYLFFDLINHWYNLRNMTYFYRYGKNMIYVPNRWLFYVRDFWPSFWADVIGTPKIVAAVFIFIAALFVFYRFWKRKNLSKPFVFITLLFAIEFFLFRYYWGERFFGYFMFFRPFIFIFTGYGFYFIYKILEKKKYGKIILVLLIILFAFSVIVRNKKILEKDALTVDAYRQIAIVYNKYPKGKFSLYICPASGTSYYSEVSKSLLFLLDMNKKLDAKGRKLALFSTGCFNPAIDVPKEFIDDRKKYKPDVIEKYFLKKEQIIPNTNLVDFSEVSEEKLKEKQWLPLTFESIYNVTCRWWFDEKP